MKILLLLFLLQLNLYDVSEKELKKEYKEFERITGNKGR